MTRTDRFEAADERIRETYDVYDDGRQTVARIADPRNGRAWIQSNRVQSVLP